MKDQVLYNDKIKLETTCVQTKTSQWNHLMRNAVKADGKKIRAMIKEQIPDLYESLGLKFYNPYESQCQRTDKHYIYVHSSIEYFLKRY